MALTVWCVFVFAVVPGKFTSRCRMLTFFSSEFTHISLRSVLYIKL